MRAPLTQEACSFVATQALDLLHAAEHAEAEYTPAAAAEVLRLLVLVTGLAGGLLCREDLTLEWLQKVRMEAGSTRAAARLLGMPKSTLHDLLRRSRPETGS